MCPRVQRTDTWTKPKGNRTEGRRWGWLEVGVGAGVDGDNWT